MTDRSDPRRKITCQCGKTIQQRHYAQHCLSKRHLAYLQTQESQEENSPTSPTPLPSPSTITTTTIESSFSLTSFLREIDLRADATLLQTIAQRYENVDPYTKMTIELKEKEADLSDYHIDHIHEVQLIACAIGHTQEFRPYSKNVLLLQPLRSVLNDRTNLAVTKASINQAKGQAIRYFLGNYQREREIPLLAAFLQTSTGKERSIAAISKNIIGLMQETSSTVSDAIRQTPVTTGHITGKSRYETVADQFDQIIDRMQLDYSDSVKLRSGKTYQAYRA